MERLLSIPDLAECLGLPKTTIYRWRHRGEGPTGYRVGKHVRYRESEVEAWLEGQRDQPKDTTTVVDGPSPAQRLGLFPISEDEGRRWGLSRAERPRTAEAVDVSDLIANAESYNPDGDWGFKGGWGFDDPEPS